MAHVARLITGAVLLLMLGAIANRAHAADEDKYTEGFFWCATGAGSCPGTKYNTLAESHAAAITAELVFRQSSYCNSYGLTVSQWQTAGLTWPAGESSSHATTTVYWTCGGAPYAGQYSAAVANRRFTCTVGVDCPAPPPEPLACDTLANVRTLGSANDQPDSFHPSPTICVKNGKIDGTTQPLGGSNGCAAFLMAEQPYKRLGPTGARDWLVRYQFTGLECDDELEQDETEIPPDCETDITGSVACPEYTSEKCHTNNGLTWCEGIDNKKNCGFANDKYVCLDSLQPDKCFAMADGSRLCVEGAPTPPVPDNGTPGVKATPDGNMQTCTGAGSCTQHNYYNSTTSTGSSRDPGTGSNSDGSGTVGPGGVPGGTGAGTDEEGAGTASGGLTCDAEPTCSGDPIQCAQLQQQWRTRCPDGPTDAQLLEAIGATDAEKGVAAGPNDGSVEVGAIGDGSGFIVGGSCPTGGSFSVMGQTISMEDLWEPACQMAVWFAPIVQAMGYFFAALLLIRGGFQ